MNITEMLLGVPYYSAKRMISKTEYLSSDAHHAFQNRKIANILNHCLKNIPYYRDLKPIGYVKDDNALECLSKISFINKEEINANLKKLTSNVLFKGYKGTTGGSTGTPLVFYLDRFVTRQREKAFMYDQWGRVDYKFGDKIFNIRGRIPKKGTFIEHDKLFNIYYASSIDMNQDSISDYVDAMNQIQPLYIHGYPSTLYQLALLVKNSKKRLSIRLNAALCGSEKLFPYQRRELENVFGCRAYSWYGHSEYLALGGECEHSQVYHMYPQYGYVELLPTGFKNEAGKELHEIVATGFNNMVMPFVRYKTGDYAILPDSPVCKCGRNYLLIDEVVGRTQEFIVDNRDNLISATSIFFGQHYQAFEGMQAIQVMQDSPGYIKIFIVKNQLHRDDQIEEMSEQLRLLLKGRMDFDYEYVDEIGKTAIGKARLVQQKLDVNKYMRK